MRGSIRRRRVWLGLALAGGAPVELYRGGSPGHDGSVIGGQTGTGGSGGSSAPTAPTGERDGSRGRNGRSGAVARQVLP